MEDEIGRVGVNDGCLGKRNRPVGLPQNVEGKTRRMGFAPPDAASERV